MKQLQTQSLLTIILCFFCFAFLSPKAISQTDCCDLDCYNSLDHIIYCGAYDVNAGPYYVKVYLRFIDPGTVDPFEDSFDDRANMIWTNLSLAFSDHKIFFVPGFGGCEGTDSYQVIQSDVLPDIDALGPFNTLMAGSSNGISHYLAGGINLYIFRDDVQISWPGHAFCLPSDYCYVAGTKACCTTPLSKTQGPAHEIAHCLGLFHTDYNDGCFDTGAPNCGELGDLVCDTPPDDGQYGNPTECSETVEVFNNIMSSFPIYTCADHFTPGQGERMRHYLKNGIGVLDDVKNQDIVITGFTTWNSPMNIEANVFIEPGGVLIVNAAVTMQENAFIYVKANLENNNTQGGQLRVDNLITTACPNKFWQGVIVEGDINQEQSSQKQGKLVILDEGIIEHARIGARVQGHDLDDGGLLEFAAGGIVHSSFGTFRNNLVDIQFARYDKKNTSFFNHTQFLTNNDYRGGTAQPPLHVFLEGVQNVRFMNSKYKDLRTDSYSTPNTRGVGIVADNSNFIVSGTSEFLNLFEGIHITEISPLGSNSVTGATFENCFTGIYSIENHNYVFTGNDFKLQRPDNYNGPSGTVMKAMYMDGKTGSFQVSGNNFIATDFSLTDYYIGTDAVAITTKNNSISDNYYESLNIGNRANGLNATGNGLIFSGLLYECNTYEGDLEHDHLIPSGAIRRVQGTFGDQEQAISSGNRYNEDFQDIIAQQFTNLGVGIDYHHILNTSQELLEDFYSSSTVAALSSDPNTNCGTGNETNCPTYPCPASGNFIPTLKSQFFQEKQEWGTKLAAFPSILNAQVQQNEARAINTLRLSMDRMGNTILLHHAMDTTSTEADSILVWLEHLDTYDADLQLARYHFFSQNLAVADTLLQAIPGRYDLSGDLLVEFNDIVSILETIRFSVQTSTDVSVLSEPILDSLATFWGADCTAAGALARNLLFQNGIRMYADCEESQERISSKVPQKTGFVGNEALWVFPNPANDILTIGKSRQDRSMSVQIIDLGTGKICLRRQLLQGETSLLLDVSALVSGVYVIAFEDEAISGQIKLVISH
ncbi:MAG: zinc-dependent metalloprotease [Saprospiraceae bacterium]